MSAKLAAKEIRKILKKQVPGVKFSVTSDSFVGGDAVDIRWEDAVPESLVENLVEKFEYHSFDAMHDIAETKNEDFDGPQAKYIQYHRAVNNQFNERVKNLILGNFWDDITPAQIRQIQLNVVRKLNITPEVTDEQIKECF